MVKGIGEARISASLREYGKIQLCLQDDMCFAENEYVCGGIQTVEDGTSTIIFAGIKCISYPYDYFRALEGESGLELSFSLEKERFRALAVRKSDPFWAKPVFFANGQSRCIGQSRCADEWRKEGQSLLRDAQGHASEVQGNICNRIQQLLLELEGKYVHIMALTDRKAVCEMVYDAKNSELKFCLSSLQGGLTHLEGALAVMTEAADPYEAVEKSYAAARKAGVVHTPLRIEKKYPVQLEGLGWCTWNAFYHDVTEDGIRAKLKEFSEKGVRLDWLIIDDGWSVFKDFKLQSFKEDRSKFPSGLKAFITSIKKEYGVKYVGVWHAFTGYWFGVEKDSEVYREQKENLEETCSNLIIPAGEYEKAYAFYHAWHSYLADQGVHFLKVDTQGNALEFLKDTPGAIAKVAALHEALEQSVQECFGGAMIDCMGMDNLDGFNRRYSSVLRSSGDFFPDKADGFRSHIEQNSYNAVFCSQLYYCDFDMWWTRHSQAKQSSALRRISGGPIYVSDKVGDTQAEYLKQLLNEDGSVTRYEDAAKPTLDCLFGYDKVLKLYNKLGNEYVVAVFNLSDEDVTTTVTKKDVGAVGDESVTVTVKAGDVEFGIL